MRPMSKQTLIPTLALVGLLAACGSAGAPAASAPAKASAASTSTSTKPSANASEAALPKPAASGTLNLGYVSPATPFLWANTAYKDGLFAKYGVTVNQPVFVGGTPRLGAALVGGTFDIAAVGFGAAIDADAAGAHLEAIAAQTKYSSFMLILPPGSTIRDPKELKGKTIVISQIGDTADSFLTVLLTRNGLSRTKDVDVIQANSTPNALTTVLAGKADAASVSSTYAFTGQTKGARILATARELNMLDLGGPVLTRKDWAEAHRPQVLGVLKGMLAANAMYRANQPQGVKILQDSGWFNDVETSVLSDIWQDDKKWNNDLPLVDEAAAQDALNVQKERDPKIASLDLHNLYDNSYLEELVKDGFVKSVYPDFKG
jgi:ABC-type nitrate/sulfonate/bicarbonate transport system substrate-binding protein